MRKAKKYILGIIGYPLGHSKSPDVYRKLIAEYSSEKPMEQMAGNVNFELYPIEPIDFEIEFPKLLLRKDIISLAVTAPYKERVISDVTSLSPEANQIGAVNFVVRTNDSWIGYNTDWIGFKNGYDVPSVTSPVVLFGAGGAARAVLYCLGKLGFKKIYVISRNPLNGERIQQWFFSLFDHNISLLPWGEFDHVVTETQKNSLLLINATPISDQPLPISWKKLLPGYACDLIYNPEQTYFLEQAQAAGFMIQNGRRMLLEQARQNLNYLNCLLGGNDYIEFS